MDKSQAEKSLKILVAAGLMEKAKAGDILKHLDLHHAKLMKARSSERSRGRMVTPEISVLEIIESLRLPLPGSPDVILEEEPMMRAIAKGLNLPFIKIDPLKLDSDIVTHGISRPFALKHQIVPIDLKGNTLTVATANPLDSTGAEGLRRAVEHEIKLSVATRSDIQRIITEFFGFKSSIAAAHQELTSSVDIGNLEQYVKFRPVGEIDSQDKHVVRAVEYMLRYAYDQRASDVHIEPKREHSIVRLRIDGMLHTIHKMPRAVHPAFVSRIKNMARMDIAEKRRPQDGRIKTSHEDKEIELRVSTLPVAFGEKVVMRIFDPDVLMRDLPALGFYERELELYRHFIAAPHGLILITGPTGSGKTSTLYSSLKTISRPEVNLTTIEDPVEMVYEEFNQTSVDQKIGTTFASTLKTLLRQDPDIIMVGEIRDFDTADNAVQASLTGHLVMSTLHTNDAPSSIARLVDLGLEEFLINATLIGVVAQRLVRVVCPHCSVGYEISPDEAGMVGVPYEEIKGTEIAMGLGCPKCRGTGYLGRSGIFEVMEMSEAIKSAVAAKAPPDDLRALAAREGFTSLRQCAIGKLKDKATTVEEVVRVLGHH